MLMEIFIIFGVVFELVVEICKSFIVIERGKWIMMNFFLMNYWNFFKRFMLMKFICGWKLVICFNEKDDCLNDIILVGVK